jgi:DUF1365 family protein
MIAPVQHIRATTWHGRKGALKNAFRYSVDYVLLDAERDGPAPGLFSRKSGLFCGLLDRDHGGPQKRGIGAPWVRQVIRDRGLDLDGPILLLAQPRIWGHVFNPVSFWLLHNRDNELCAVIAEVNNTFGDRHSYLCYHPDLRPITRTDRMHAEKIFHVSPFQPVEGNYEFRFDIQPDKVFVWINLDHPDGGLMANLVGSRRVMRTRDILWSMLRRPFGSRRVLGLIYFQAFKLKFKGAKYRDRSTPPKAEVS